MKALRTLRALAIDAALIGALMFALALSWAWKDI